MHIVETGRENKKCKTVDQNIRKRISFNADRILMAVP